LEEKFNLKPAFIYLDDGEGFGPSKKGVIFLLKIKRTYHAYYMLGGMK